MVLQSVHYFAAHTVPGLAKCCTCKHERTHSRHRATQLHVISFQLTAASRYLVQSQKHWAILIFKYNQQDATLHNLFISVKSSTCFTRFLRPSSGAQNCIYSIVYFVKPLLLPATVSSNSTTTVAVSSKGLTKYPMLYIILSSR